MHLTQRKKSFLHCLPTLTENTSIMFKHSPAVTQVTSSLPKTHRAIVLHSTRDPYNMTVVQQSTPKPGPGSAVIRVVAAGVLTYGGRVYSGKKPYPYPVPFVPGLNAIGRIAAVGPDATILQPGQLVFFDCYIHGRDDPESLILHGLSSGFNTRSNTLMENEWRDSTYAEYAKVPLENCFALDESRLLGSPSNGGLGYTANDLTYLSTLSVPWGGLSDVDVRAGQKVIVTPATGTYGSAAVLCALAMGARVIAMGRDMQTLEQLKTTCEPELASRISLVQNTGDVDADVKALTADGMADVFFDISPGKASNSTHYKSCVQALRRGGRMSLMGAHTELPLPTLRIMLYDIKVHGKWMYFKEDIRKLIRLLEYGFMKLGRTAGVQTVGAFGLEEFDKAFEAAAKMRGAFLQTIIAP